MPSYVIHPEKFRAFQDARFEDGRIVKPEATTTDLVEAPVCGFWVVVWNALHPEYSQQHGVMLVSREHHAQYARNMVSEVLWARGYVGDYQVEVTP